MYFGFKQQSDTHKILTVAVAAVVCLGLFFGMLYAFYWDENTPSKREGKTETHATESGDKH